MSDLYIRITRPEGYEDVHPDLILQDIGIDPVWGAEVVDVEAVLRECREALVPYMKYVDGTNVLNHPAQCVAKIDEVLNVPDISRTA